MFRSSRNFLQQNQTVKLEGRVASGPDHRCSRATPCHWFWTLDDKSWNLACAAPVRDHDRHARDSVLHLDESDCDNGPLRVIPGTHRHRRLYATEIAAFAKNNCVTCTVPEGGALVMRPLVLHASSACVVNKPRRVIHLEFAAEELSYGLRWYHTVERKSAT
jgi:Phytanoyl-CoA dioxygenase (PhyH)